jgi:hypothetical protein
MSVVSSADDMRWELAGPIFVALFPKLTWTIDSNRQVNGRLQYVSITRDQGVGLAGHSRSDDPFVIGVAQSKVKMLSRFGDDLMVTQEMFDVSDDLGRYVDLIEQGSLELGQHDFADDQVVFDKNVAQQIRAHSTARECTDEHVRVEKHPHDTAEKTSSSVRSPRASANGRTIFRRRSKRSRDN